MKDGSSQAPVIWDCKDHAVIVPKYRQRVFFGKRRKEIGAILCELCRQKEIEWVKGNAQPDHVHMLLSVPPKHSIAMTLGYLKGQSAWRIHRELMKTRGTLFGRSFWSRGCCVSTVGLDEALIRRYIQEQDQHERDQERGLFDNEE